MKLGIVGLGYVGITSMAAFARDGHKLIGYEANQEKLDTLNAGAVPISEPKVGELIEQNFSQIEFRNKIDESVNTLDCLMICVGTPTDEFGKSDLSALKKVINELNKVSKCGIPIFIRSTIPIGTTSKLQNNYPQLNLNFHPEFLREGTAIADFFDPPKIILGIHKHGNSIAEKVFNELYAGFHSSKVKVSFEIAEAVKYVDNSFHALKVVFTNEVSKVIAKNNANPVEVMEIFRSDKRLNISEAYLKPGFAYGGSCLEKDLLSFCSQNKDQALPLLEAISVSNELVIDDFYKKVTKLGSSFIFNGLAFKENTDDLRRSPFVTLVIKLLNDGHNIFSFDENLTVCFGESLNILNKLLEYPNFHLNSTPDLYDQNSILIRCHQKSHQYLPKSFSTSFDLFFGGNILNTLK